MSRHHTHGPDACGAPWSEHAYQTTSKNRVQRVCPDDPRYEDRPERPQSGPEPDAEELLWDEDYVDDWPRPTLLDPVPGEDDPR